MLESLSLQQLAHAHPAVITALQAHGLGAYVTEEALQKLGRYIRLGTLLRDHGIEPETFLSQVPSDDTDPGDDSIAEVDGEQGTLDLLAMLPCGLRNPYKMTLEEHLAAFPERYDGLQVRLEGNVNHELTYYPLLDHVRDVDELPDLLISSDINHLIHAPFRERFVEQGVFADPFTYTPQDYLRNAGLIDPQGAYTMLTANMLVMAVDTNRLSGPLPQRWTDLLDDRFLNEIIMRGEGEFFCTAVLLPFYQQQGMAAIRTLARHIRIGKHPAEMVKLAGSNHEEAAAVYILPEFFARKIRAKGVEIVWPEDGAIASPVFLLAKAEACEGHRALLDFLLSQQMSELCVERGFPACHPGVDHQCFPPSVTWVGWDFLRDGDVGALKEHLKAVVIEERRTSNGAC